MQVARPNRHQRQDANNQEDEHELRDQYMHELRDQYMHMSVCVLGVNARGACESASKSEVSTPGR